MTRFLSGLSSWFTKSQAPRAQDFVTDRGYVARFVFKPRDLSVDGRSKPRAFAPERHPALGRYETSVCGLTGVADDRLWFLGKTVRASSGLTAIAAVQIGVPKVVAVGLSCEAAPEPAYKEHGVVVGWHSDPEAKDERLARQVDLAASVLLEHVRRPPETSPGGP